MTSEIDIWRTAQLLIRRYGDEAPHEADRRAADLHARGESSGAAAWRRIAGVAAALQRREPDGPVH
ncbi:MAG: hypothetical protein ACFCVH_03665 [Alphaproteobacteria bacterium]